VQGGPLLRKIGILGGTFDPPHNGHLLIANEVLEALKLDEIKFIPNQEPPHKKKSTAVSNFDRLTMLELAVAGHPKFIIDTIELERSGLSYTFDTIKSLKELHPDVQFFFIIGADMIEYLPNWYKIDDLIELVDFVGVNRPDYVHTSSFPILHVPVPEFGVTSSLIRNRIKEGHSVRYLLPESVRLYIEENELYES
jgi:nicotinate-nucleotide adenylyltransferase